MTDSSTELTAPSRRVIRRGRPELYTAYAADQALFNTPAKRISTGVLLLVVAAAPFLLSRDMAGLLTTAMIYAIGAIGLNLVTGYAGQVSLGHAFFVGLGAYTAATLGSPASGSLRGYDLEMWIWLPAAGLVAAFVGFLVAPLASRVRGLYLAILTLGLVFIGEHIFREMRSFTGGPGVGRRAAAPIVAGFDLSANQTILGFEIPGFRLFYLFCLVMLVVMAIAARNLARSKVGRAFAAVRDRDIAAEVMGVKLARTKVLAFTISSFYAGICGALLATSIRQIEPLFFNLNLSVLFLAMILVGGVATISGAIVGAVFIQMLPRFVQWLSGYVPGLSRSAQGGVISVDQAEGMLFGVLIVVFLILEPRGIYGMYLRVRNYFKAWPFSY
jgi:branched-chain amino acid transport system permease protein